MDTEQETGKLKWLLGFGLAFLVSLWFAVGELNYAVRGTTVDGSITSAEEVVARGRRGRETQKLQVRYRFTDAAGNQRDGVQSVNADWDGPRSGTVPVRYLPGVDGGSRIADQTNVFGLVIFGVLFAILLAWGIKFWLDVRAAVEPTSTRRR
jgi:hypothetical protein